MRKSLWLLERVKGIEPSSQAWEARILPLNHTRVPLPTLPSSLSVASLQIKPARRIRAGDLAAIFRLARRAASRRVMPGHNVQTILIRSL